MVLYKIRIDEAVITFIEPHLAEAQARVIAEEKGTCCVDVIYPGGGGYCLVYDDKGNAERAGRRARIDT